MFNRQFTLLAIATLLLSPSLVHANEIDGDRNLSVGNIQILNTDRGTIIQTPNIHINTPKASTDPVIVSRMRRRGTPVIRRTRTSTPLIFNKKVNSDSRTTVTTTTSPSVPNSTVRSATIRNSSSSGDGSQSVNEQQQSIQCSGSGSSVSQSTSTVNGRTVSSQSRTSCN